jgi:DNA-binding MurR/RpiR family transcriptional regulator
MAILYKIEQGMQSYTKTEKKIADYLLVNYLEAINLSANDLGKKSNTSSAAIIRFAHKLGYVGLNSLKVDLASTGKINRINDYDPITKNDNFESVIFKSQLSNKNIISKTYNMINENTLFNAVQILKKSKRIYLVGIGDSSLSCYDFKLKMARLDMNIINNLDFHIQLASLTHIKEDDCVLAISFSGETKDVLVATEYAKSKEAKVISITQFNNNHLSKLSDVSLYIPSEELDDRLGPISSRLSSLIITDLLYLQISQDRIEDTNIKVKLTNELIDKIKFK